MKQQHNTGKVYLVGAGPGDPELLTVKAMRLLQQSQVIIYDALVNTSLLNLAPAAAERIFVGQPRTPHRMSQQEIETLMIKKAREGKSVVRLKGGDPFLFGRGGEEALALIQSAIPFEVIPGVTAGSAVPAYAGIPLTHRGLASSVAFITGHECDSGSTDIDLRTIAGSVDTLVIFMGITKLKFIVQEILRSGRSPDTPMAIIEQGTTASQRIRKMTLATAKENTERKAVRTPALIVVGEVVAFSDSLKGLEEHVGGISLNQSSGSEYEEVLSGIS
jgi:uroporphyrinogen III methyltransferase/synthase